MSELEYILNHIQEEIRNLKSEIEQCLGDFDYEGAHLFQRALRFKSIEENAIRSRLQGNNYEIRKVEREIRLAEGKVAYYSEKVSDKLSKIRPKRKKYLKTQISHYKQLIDRYTNQIITLYKTSKLKHIDNDILIHTVEQLLNDELEWICLEIVGNGISYITILNQEHNLEVEFVKGDVDPRSRMVNVQFQHFLLGLGFVKNDLNNWTLIIDIRNVVQDHIMVILSSICFDVIRATNDTTCKLIVQNRLIS